MKVMGLMNRASAWTGWRGGLVALGLVALGGCSVVPSNSPTAGRVQVSLPAEQEWVDLGGGDEALDPAGQSVVAPTLPTRVFGLRGPGKDKPLLAVFVVQANRSGDVKDRHFGLNACAEERGVYVDDRAAKSPTRIDCLRFKRWADGHDWLAKSYPVVSAYLTRLQVAALKPYGYLNFRYNTEAGAYVSVQVLVNRQLVQPATRNNDDFLVSGQPALIWAQQMAQAARVSAASLDGAMLLPAFPMPLPN